MTTNIPPLQNTNNIRYADFVRIVTPSQTFRFSTAATSITVPSVDSQPFSALGALVGIGKIQRDIKSTANQTTDPIRYVQHVLSGRLGTNAIGSAAGGCCLKT